MMGRSIGLLFSVLLASLPQTHVYGRKGGNGHKGNHILPNHSKNGSVMPSGGISRHASPPGNAHGDACVSGAVIPNLEPPAGALVVDIGIHKSKGNFFATVPEAFKRAAELTPTQDVIIFIKRGKYAGKSTLDLLVQGRENKHSVTVYGETPNMCDHSLNLVHLTHHATFDTPDSKQGLNSITTLTLTGYHISVYNLKIENTGTKNQAPALSTKGQYQYLYGCSMMSEQDVWYLFIGSAMFIRGNITSIVDMISNKGAGLVVTDSTITIANSGKRDQVFILASGRENDKDPGSIVDNCHIEFSPGKEWRDDHVFLGRDWKQWALASIQNTFIDGPMKPWSELGWSRWKKNDHHYDAHYTYYNLTGDGVRRYKGTNHFYAAKAPVKFATWLAPDYYKFLDPRFASWNEGQR
ncbi:pectinesterase-domain-containing protein [Protomyces lactucae-debilis]|uniref:pectinesterase n=1 Tax=Protomyces lactucae-debilis TaxID=2754530 RepID=A0A1Y2FTV6_PROLT|nr:pectinesterase-domain-containing protein [Protomyces lactucae-debilis]ORY86125.1 pectinesterase-domain-containing protein [Protomyces lactucae-debilis]